MYHHDYFPEIIFSTELESKLNPYHQMELLGDKSMLPVLFVGVYYIFHKHIYPGLKADILMQMMTISHAKRSLISLKK